MRCLIDADILLDVLADRELFVKDAETIFKLCETGIIEGYVSVLSFANIVYVLRKELDPPKIESVLLRLRMIFRFADLKEDDLIKAASLRWRDYEDGVQMAIAMRIRAEAIVTRNADDFADGSIKVLTPGELLNTYRSES